MIQQANNENPKTWNAASAVALSKILPPEEEQDLVWDGISEIIASFEDSSMQKMLHRHGGASGDLLACSHALLVFL
jgi:hypothetical protein